MLVFGDEPLQEAANYVPQDEEAALAAELATETSRENLRHSQIRIFAIFWTGEQSAILEINGQERELTRTSTVKALKMVIAEMLGITYQTLEREWEVKTIYRFAGFTDERTCTYHLLDNGRFHLNKPALRHQGLRLYQHLDPELPCISIRRKAVRT